MIPAAPAGTTTFSRAGVPADSVVNPPTLMVSVRLDVRSVHAVESVPSTSAIVMSAMCA